MDLAFRQGDCLIFLSCDEFISVYQKGDILIKIIQMLFTWIVLSLTLQSISLPLRCHPDPYLQNKLDQLLKPFSNGITSEMIDKLAAYPRTCLVEIKDKKLVSACVDNLYQHFFCRIAEHLPDMKFVINQIDEPRVFKNKCEEGQNWMKCACDEEY